MKIVPTKEWNFPIICTRRVFFQVGMVIPSILGGTSSRSHKLGVLLQKMYEPIFFRILTNISNGLFLAARSVQKYGPLEFPMQARLVLGVPTDVQKKDGSPGRDTIQFNVHR